MAQSSKTRRLSVSRLSASAHSSWSGERRWAAGGLCDPDVVVGVAATHRRGVAAGFEALPRVLTDALEQPVAHRAVIAGVGDDQRLVDEMTQRVDDVQLVQVVPGQHRLRGLQVTAAGEYRQTVQRLLLGQVEQVVGPVDRAPQCLVPLERGTAPTGQELEPLIESSDEILRRQRTHPAAASSMARGMPSRRRHSTPTVPAFRSSSTKSCRAADARSENRRTASASARAATSASSAGTANERTATIRSPGERESFATRHEHRHSLTPPHDRVDLAGDGVEEVLGVVEDQQQRAWRPGTRSPAHRGCDRDRAAPEGSRPARPTPPPGR